MRFSIAHEIPGRMRLRCGSGIFLPKEARGIEGALLQVEGVRQAQVREANGSILVCFAPVVREQVLDAVRELDLLHLPQESEETGLSAPESASRALDLALADEDRRFHREVGGLVVRKLIRRYFFPLPLRRVWTTLRALRRIVRGLRDLMSHRLTVEVLDATAIAACLLRGTHAEAGTIMFLLRLSEAMERHVSSRTRLALEGGLVSRSGDVWIVEDGRDRRVSIDEVTKGTLVRLRAGDVSSVDGCVEEGEAELDEASMTGESRSVHKGAGSSIYAGTVLIDGEMVVRVTAPPGQARIDAIAQMVDRASELKASSQGKAERLADDLVPVAFAAFFAIFAITRNIEKALAVLMVDYSCAIRLSTPVAVMSAMREAANHDVVVKGGKYLEALAEADTVVFDKTGTLTEAAPQLTAVVSAGRVSEGGILRLAACIEEHFPHSVARAIVEGANSADLPHEQELHARVQYVVAHGIVASVGGKRAVIGSAHFVFEDEDVAMPEGFDELCEAAAPGAGRVYLARDGELLGALCVSDPLRPEARDALEALRALGISNIVMLTGDSEQAAAAAAQAAGVDSYHAQVLPEDKASYVEELVAAGHRVIMVGDGINDSPALAAASVSVAMADASDVARTVADVSLRDASLARLALARELSQRLQRRIASRYRLIVGFNSTLIALGVASLIPLTTAATLHNLSTVAIAASNTRPLLRS